MRYTMFGQTGLRVSQIGFGCARIGGVFAGGSARTDTIRLLHQALDAGITFYDTSSLYAQGESEALLGRAFRGKRDRVFLASKGGYCLPGQRRLAAHVKPLLRPIVRALGIKRQHLPGSLSGTLSQDFSARALTSSLEASLKRLNTEYVDLYQLHSPPPEVIESGAFIAVMEQLKAQGKIRFYGVAADTVEHALLCLRYPGISSLMVPFGMLDPEAIDTLLGRAQAQGVAVIGRGCFGGGLLKETLTEQELRALTPKWPEIMAYRAMARNHQLPLLEMALRFSLATAPIAVHLLGMHTLEQLRQNLAYAQAAPLPEHTYRAIIETHQGAYQLDA